MVFPEFPMLIDAINATDTERLEQEKKDAWVGVNIM